VQMYGRAARGGTASTSGESWARRWSGDLAEEDEPRQPSPERAVRVHYLCPAEPIRRRESVLSRSFVAPCSATLTQTVLTCAVLPPTPSRP